MNYHCLVLLWSIFSTPSAVICFLYFSEVAEEKAAVSLLWAEEFIKPFPNKGIDSIQLALTTGTAK